MNCMLITSFLILLKLVTLVKNENGVVFNSVSINHSVKYFYKKGSCLHSCRDIIKLCLVIFTFSSYVVLTCTWYLIYDHYQ